MNRQGQDQQSSLKESAQDHSALACFGNDHQLEAEVLKEQGDAKQQEGDLAGARADYEAALRTYREIHDRFGEANCRRAIGCLFLAEGKPEAAHAEYQAALEIYQENKYWRPAVGSILLDLADASREAGDQAQAVLFSEQALDTFRRGGFRRGEAEGLYRQGIAFFHLGNVKGSLAALWQAREILQGLGRPEAQRLDALFEAGAVGTEATTREGIIRVLSSQAEEIRRGEVAKVEAEATLREGRRLVKDGAWQQGLETLRHARKLFSKLGNLHGKARAAIEIGDVYLRFGDYEVAEMSFRDAERYLRKRGDEAGIAVTQLKLGTLALYKYQPQEAQKHLQAASAFFHAHGDTKRAEISDRLLNLAPEFEQRPL